MFTLSYCLYGQTTGKRGEVLQKLAEAEVRQHCLQYTVPYGQQMGGGQLAPVIMPVLGLAGGRVKIVSRS